MTDKSIMKFGVHRGKTLDDIPAGYLFNMLEQGCPEDLERYIVDNRDRLISRGKKEDGGIFTREYLSGLLTGFNNGRINISEFVAELNKKADPFIKAKHKTTFSLT